MSGNGVGGIMIRSDLIRTRLKSLVTIPGNLNDDDDVDLSPTYISYESNIVHWHKLKVAEPVIAVLRPNPKRTVDGSILS